MFSHHIFGFFFLVPKSLASITFSSILAKVLIRIFGPADESKMYPNLPNGPSARRGAMLRATTTFVVCCAALLTATCILCEIFAMPCGSDFFSREFLHKRDRADSCWSCWRSARTSSFKSMATSVTNSARGRKRNTSIAPKGPNSSPTNSASVVETESTISACAEFCMASIAAASTSILSVCCAGKCLVARLGKIWLKLQLTVNQTKTFVKNFLLDETKSLTVLEATRKGVVAGSFRLVEGRTVCTSGRSGTCRARLLARVALGSFRRERRSERVLVWISPGIFLLPFCSRTAIHPALLPLILRPLAQKKLVCE
mmetsp:Transcript_50907/g.82345  ORF Transcript_50907/g.82345 Transcript_50907/m.82345 type:complete len:314 (-) Transcript_50907:71-1012(-)